MSLPAPTTFPLFGRFFPPGSPLAPRSFDYVYQKIKEDLLLASISGGTDIVSCFALGNPIGPVYRSEIQTRGLGMKVEIYNDEGETGPGRKRRAGLHGAVPFHAGEFLERSGRGKISLRLFRTFPRRLAARRLRRVDRT